MRMFWEIVEVTALAIGSIILAVEALLLSWSSSDSLILIHYSIMGWLMAIYAHLQQKEEKKQ